MRRSLQWIFLLLTASAFAYAPEPKFVFPRGSLHAYDDAGNLATRINATLTQTFSVDNANRLTSASRSGTLTAAGTANTLAQNVMVNEVGADLYTDDTFATTNGLTLADGNNELRFKATDAFSQSVTITQVFNLPASVYYDYDLNGNLTSDGAREYEYDDADRLVRITAADLWKSEFVYDAFGRRIIRREYSWENSQWAQQDEVRYVWLGMSVLQERDAANNVKVTYTGRLAREDATSTSFYFADGNGNVSSLVDTGGNIKARYRYDSFGNLLSKSGPLADANLIRFSGKEYHANSGLYYYGFRFYAPNLQRWMNEDPIGIAGGLNLYGFVGNDPVNLIDLFGAAPYHYDPHDPTTWIFPSEGKWSGRPGSSLWTPPDGSDIAKATKGRPIQWSRGTPNLIDYSVGPSYKGKTLPKCVKNIPFTGDAGIDRDLAIKKLAAQSGLKQYEVEAALSRNNLRLHHYFNGEMQLVPYDIHRVPHSGVASGIRAGTLRAGGALIRTVAIGVTVLDPVGAFAGPVTEMGDATWEGHLYRMALIVDSPEGHDIELVRNAHETLETGMQLGTPTIPSDLLDKLADFLNRQSFDSGCHVNTPALKP